MSDEAAELGRLSEAFFEAQNRADPLGATLLGIEGYDGLLPDLTREGARGDAARFAAIEAGRARLDPAALDERGRTNLAVLERR